MTSRNRFGYSVEENPLVGFRYESTYMRDNKDNRLSLRSKAANIEKICCDSTMT